MKKNDLLREWRARNPEKVKASLKSYYQQNAEKLRQRQREYYHANKERCAAIKRRARENQSPEKRAAELEKKRVTTMMRRYGLTPEDYDTMLESQSGTCAICSRTPDQERYKRLNVDHCHDTGKVRGLLCTPCNHAIGVLGDTVEHLRRAVAYLER